jgi:hypothetical protein
MSTKRHARLPLLDAREPAQAQAVEPEAVLDQRADAHLDRAGRDDLEAQQRRRDASRLPASAKNSNTSGIAGQALGAAQRVVVITRTVRP